MTTATADLTRALINLAAAGLRTHCSDPTLSELWVSDHEAERAEAVRLCHGCPVILECRHAAEARDERWHVWGGRDYTRRQRKAACLAKPRRDDMAASSPRCWV